MPGPSKTKYRTTFTRSLRGFANKGTNLEYGEVGLVSLNTAFIKPNQLEAARKVISHVTKRTGKLWIRVFADQVITTKPANVRMGSGKGAPDHYSAAVKTGRVLMEVGGISKELAIKALLKAAQKLPVQTKIIEK